eukprot:scaffold574_cov190-Amphora_coffeaeformis.AAC.10
MSPRLLATWKQKDRPKGGVLLASMDERLDKTSQSFIMPRVPVLPIALWILFLRNICHFPCSQAFLVTIPTTGTKYPLLFTTMTTSSSSLQRRMITGRDDGEEGNDSVVSSSSPKENLLHYLERFTDTTWGRLPCGLECTEAERATVLDLITQVVVQDVDNNNYIQPTNNRVVNDKDLLGTWNLLYTSSRTMRINKSLSGLGRSESTLANVASISKTYTGTKYLGFVQYVERIGTTTDGFDVTMAGEWMFEPSTDPFTGNSLMAMRLDLRSVEYAGTKQKGETWASLGPIKLMDIVLSLQTIRRKAHVFPIEKNGLESLLLVGFVRRGLGRLGIGLRISGKDGFDTSFLVAPDAGFGRGIRIGAVAIMVHGQGGRRMSRGRRRDKGVGRRGAKEEQGGGCRALHAINTVMI